MSFTDDASGIDGFFLTFESVDTNQQIGFSLFPDFSGELLNGNLLEGSIGNSTFIDPFTPSGDYVLSFISGSDKAGNGFNKSKDDSDWQQFLSDSNIQQTSFEIKQSDSDNGAVDADNNGLVDNTPVYTLFNDGDPLIITNKQGKTFSSTGIPNWDATQAIKAGDGSGNFYVLLEGADGTTREDQFLAWTTNNTGLIKSSTGWQSAEQFAQDDLGQLFSIDIAVDADNNGLEDTTPPELLSYTLSDYNIDLSNGDVTIDVTAAIRDDISGVFDGTFADGVGGSASQVTWTSPSGTQSVFGGLFDDPVTGDFLNGTYTDQAVFNQFSENGTWTLDNFLVVDEAGNSIFLSTDQLNELGIQTTLEVIGGMSDLTPNSTEILT